MKALLVSDKMLRKIKKYASRWGYSCISQMFSELARKKLACSWRNINDRIYENKTRH